MDKRTIDLDEVFSSTKQIRGIDLKTNFKQLKYLMEKQIQIWWDINTLELYIKERITPRRLRWNIPANDGLIDKDLDEEWFTSIRVKQNYWN